MKVYLSGYRNHWLSPYTILEKVFFWREIDYDEPIIERLSNILTPPCKAWQAILNFVHPKIEYVKIDRYDTWSMDHTLAHIILPMLKQLKKDKHGSPFTDDEDVPEELRSTSAPAKENEWDTDENWFKRWDWIMDEIIFAFECKLDDSWEDAFREGEIDWKTVPCAWDENGKPTLYKSEDGPNHTYKCDYDGMKVVNDRIQNGFRLFGKYYQGLWD
jgi:YD repeat-containing protein